MYRIAAAVLTGIALVNGPSARAQAPVAAPTSVKFEVASLKPSPPGGRGGGIRPTLGGERYVATNIPLKLLITVAYRVKAEQVVGGPDCLAARPDAGSARARPDQTQGRL